MKSSIVLNVTSRGRFTLSADGQNRVQIGPNGEPVRHGPEVSNLLALQVKSCCVQHLIAMV